MTRLLLLAALLLLTGCGYHVEGIMGVPLRIEPNPPCYRAGTCDKFGDPVAGCRSHEWGPADKDVPCDGKGAE